jgi:hypothetical protein
LIQIGEMQYLVYDLFNNTVSNSGYMEHQMTERSVNKELESMQKELVIV